MLHHQLRRGWVHAVVMALLLVTGSARSQDAPEPAPAEASLATIVLAVVDEAGADVVGAQLWIDGQPRSVQDGLPLALAPGAHELMVAAPGMEPYRAQVVARYGEMNRILRVTLARQAPPAAAASSVTPPVASPPSEAGASDTGMSFLVPVGFSLAGVGLVLGTVMGVVASERHAELELQCKTQGCTQEDIDSGTTLAHVSTAGFVALGVGAALGVTGLVIGLGGEEPDAAQLRLGPDGAQARFRF